MTERSGGVGLSDAGLLAAADFLLGDDYDRNLAGTRVWKDLTPTSRRRYLHKAQDVVTAYLAAAEG